ncbi:hypothetical protein BKG71_19290 [Mycobacteroides chelonae]|nr:hypothetical protein BKG71_19290 [Mycobacteroides chelonae]
MTITASQMIQEIRKLADEKPDRKAECVYWVGKEPVCIVGHAAHRLGLDMTVPHGDALMALGQWGVTGKKVEKAWIATVQAAQDGRLNGKMSWYSAVYAADGAFGDLLR